MRWYTQGGHPFYIDLKYLYPVLKNELYYLLNSYYWVNVSEDKQRGLDILHDYSWR